MSASKEAVMPRFQPVIKLAQLRKQGVDVAKPLDGDLRSTIKDEDFAE